MKNLPPQAVEHEQAILAGMLIDPELCERALEALKPNHFYKTSHQLIFTACKDLFDTQKPVNLITVAEFLRSKGQLDKVGGASYLASLPDEVPVPSSVTHYAQVIREKYNLREVSRAANELLNGCFANDAKASALIEAARDSLASIAEQGVDIGKILDNGFIKRVSEGLWDQIDHNAQAGMIGQQTGFRFIDNTTFGLVKTFLYIIGAYTSIGKTALMVQTIVNAIKLNPDIRIAVFSTEMSRFHILLRLIANFTGISSLGIFQGNLGQEEFEAVNGAIDYFDSKTLWIFDDAYRFEDIRDRCRGLKNLDVVFVDFLQNVQGAGSIYERMSVLPIALQKMAKDLDVAVVAMSQVSNESVQSDQRIIGFKGAGEIAAACDFGCWLVRDEDDDHLLNCFIRKNRHGRCGKTKLRYSGNFTSMSEVE